VGGSCRDPCFSGWQLQSPATLRETVGPSVVKKMSARRALELVTKGEWAKDDDICKVVGLDGYVNSSGQAMIVVGTRATIFSDRDEFLAYMRTAAAEAPRHLLQERFNYSGDFPRAVPRLVALLGEELGLAVGPDGLDASEASLDLVESALSARRHRDFLEGERFAAVVAYVGEVLSRACLGSWEMRRVGDVWEPWVVDREGRAFAPFAVAFKELRRGPRGSLRGAVAGTLRSHRLG
jgi:hypothetical protein